METKLNIRSRKFALKIVGAACIFTSVSLAPLAANAQNTKPDIELPIECRKFETPLGLDVGRAMSVMRTSDWRSRSKVVRCLSFLSEAGELLSVVEKDADARVRRTALFALGEKSIPSSLYSKLLLDKDPLVRSLATRYAYLSGPESIGTLLRVSTDIGALLEQRVLALNSLSQLGSSASSSRNTLATLILDKQPAVRVASIKAIGEMGSSAADVLPKLRARLRRVGKNSLEAGWIRESIVKLDPSRLGNS